MDVLLIRISTRSTLDQERHRPLQRNGVRTNDRRSLVGNANTLRKWTYGEVDSAKPAEHLKFYAFDRTRTVRTECVPNSHQRRGRGLIGGGIANLARNGDKQKRATWFQTPLLSIPLNDQPSPAITWGVHMSRDRSRTFTATRRTS